MSNGNKTPTYVYSLGGIGEVGKNMYIVENDNDVIIIDCGIVFKNDGRPGITGAIPSFEALEGKNIRALVITHGHEDHIGGIPYLLSQFKIPKVYAPKIASELIRNRLREFSKSIKPKIILTDNRSELKEGQFNMSFFNTNHSIPDSMGVKVDTPNGRVVYTGDFKIDIKPIGQKMDFIKMAKLGNEGIDLLLSDSTASLNPNFSVSETDVAKSIEKICKEAKGRVFIGSFSSNIHRLGAIVKIAMRLKKKILVFGRSMEKNIMIARKVKYINAPESMFIQGRYAKRYNDDELIVLTTGTQGEELAALSRIARGEHRDIKLKSTDTVVFSSSPIPGNFEAANVTLNNLSKAGCTVITRDEVPTIHASGHASIPEQAIVFDLLRPKYFMPVHGEYRMQWMHKQTAIKSGIREENSFILARGQKAQLLNGKVTANGHVPTDIVYVDGEYLGAQATSVMSDRVKLGSDGVVTVTVNVCSNKNILLSPPIITTVGIVADKEEQRLKLAISGAVAEDLTKFYNSGARVTFGAIKDVIRESTTEVTLNARKKQPVIIPVILNKQEIKKDAGLAKKKPNPNERQNKSPRPNNRPNHRRDNNPNRNNKQRD